jgi:uncharacterized protein involved in tolerance to divalent cations
MHFNSFHVCRWKDKIETDKELLLIMKTQTRLLPELEKDVRANHPYEVPEGIRNRCIMCRHTGNFEEEEKARQLFC